MSLHNRSLKDLKSKPFPYRGQSKHYFILVTFIIDEKLYSLLLKSYNIPNCFLEKHLLIINYVYGSHKVW
jgi:hypothetical protein